MKLLPFVLSLLVSTSFAAKVEVSAKFADVPAGTKIPATAAALDKLKGVDVLSAPQATTQSGQAAQIEISQEHTAPDGEAVPLGVTLHITPTLEGKTVSFTGWASDRAMGGRRTDGAVTQEDFVTRESHFSGSTPVGQSISLRTAPWAGAAGKSASRELVVFLTFRAIEEATAKSPVKSIKTTTITKPTAKPVAKPVTKTATKPATTKPKAKR
jgi:hypothetical protein